MASEMTFQHKERQSRGESEHRKKKPKITTPNFYVPAKLPWWSETPPTIDWPHCESADRDDDTTPEGPPAASPAALAPPFSLQVNQP